MNFSYRTVSQKMLSIVYNKILARTNWKKRERTKWNKKKMNKNDSVLYEAFLTRVKVLKIVQREHLIPINFFLMTRYFASKIQQK